MSIVVANGCSIKYLICTSQSYGNCVMVYMYSELTCEYTACISGVVMLSFPSPSITIYTLIYGI